VQQRAHSLSPLPLPPTHQAQGRQCSDMLKTLSVLLLLYADMLIGSQRVSSIRLRLDYCQLTVVSYKRTLQSRLSRAHYPEWTIQSGLSNVDYPEWTIQSGLSRVDYPEWTIQSGLSNVDYPEYLELTIHSGQSTVSRADYPELPRADYPEWAIHSMDNS